MKTEDIPSIVLEDHLGEARALGERFSESALTVFVFYRGDW